MWQIDRAKAKAWGYSDEEIDSYLNNLNAGEKIATTPTESPQPQIEQTQAPLPPPTTEKESVAPSIIDSPFPKASTTPDVVLPIEKPVQTQYIAENPQNYPATGGHAGIDEISSDYSTRQTNPIGGRIFPFYEPPQGYGNAALIVGGNPQEVAQMSPEEIQRIQDEVNAKGATAASAADFNIPGHDVSIQGHLANLDNYQSGQPVATGSAVFNMGEGYTAENGNWPQHAHWEVNDSTGKQVDPIEFYQDKTGQKYPINPSQDYTPSEKSTIDEHYKNKFLEKYPEFRGILATYR